MIEWIFFSKEQKNINPKQEKNLKNYIDLRSGNWQNQEPGNDQSVFQGPIIGFFGLRPKLEAFNV